MYPKRGERVRVIGFWRGQEYDVQGVVLREGRMVRSGAVLGQILFVIVDKKTFASQVLGVVGLPTDGYKIRNRRKKGHVERAVYQWRCGCTADIAESQVCPNVVEATFVKMCTPHKKRSIFVR